MKNKFIVLLSLFALASCSTRNEIVYFQGAEQLENMKGAAEFEPVFEINDIIHIKVTSLNPEVVQPFQMQTGGQSSGSGGGGGGRQNSSLMGYLVDIDGNIQFPVLGKIKVAGKSRSELETFLTDRIHAYVKDAVVAVRLLNFRVIVLGEAGSQTIVDVENERMSVPELFGSVGGITYDGIRNNILIIREVDGVKSIGRIDMTKADVFKSPYYYLRQNDIVYVEPTYRKVKSAGFITSYTGLISLATTIFGIIVLITR
ncbi:polysaccharide biosynthesis/export family protein [Gillisia sp. Hel_I_86]|uniref:polysaccharide biosynthesis/export family protein n=1 Tax=Gillisia sp. Hel_I_86 TaxID=1249981 RepID=UPI0011A72022|nr:polysaccharide biosynthesis/export family protein [Gillisia sp. Hel_I_86]